MTSILQRHLRRLERRIRDLETRSEALIRQRLLAFFGGLFATLTALAIHNGLALVVFIVTSVGFSVLVARHNRVKTTLDQFKGWHHIKVTHLARVTLDWDTLPPSKATAPRTHPFALDIDLVGEYSIHRLLDTSVSQGGSDRLRDWLLATEPQSRQPLVKELLPLAAFRDRLALNATLATHRQPDKWDADRLLRWAESPDQAGGWLVLLFLAALSGINIVLFLLFNLAGLPPLWVVSFVLYVIVSSLQWRRLGGLFSEGLALQNQVMRLRAIFRHLETTAYSGKPHLKALCAPFLDRDQRPTAQLRRLSLITAAASIQRNPVLWIILNLIVPWDVFFASLLERNKGELAAVLPGWLDVWYELEALGSLANFAYLNPEYTFPRVDLAIKGLHGDQLGHPLIPKAEKVCNDFVLRDTGQVVIITGSNMSGKSSFLRTLGVNLVLAYAGTVTNADHFETGTLRLYTAIRVTDSVVDGISYFYAEVKRLKALLDAVKADDPRPVFFLIDEIFRGTNNRERLVGSQSYIMALVGGNSLGLIATHDLELANLADTIREVSNFHFRETVANGRMVFDYTIRPGPSPTTNALTIMRLEGLPVGKP